MVVTAHCSPQLESSGEMQVMRWWLTIQQPCLTHYCCRENIVGCRLICVTPWFVLLYMATVDHKVWLICVYLMYYLVSPNNNTLYTPHPQTAIHCNLHMINKQLELHGQSNTWCNEVEGSYDAHMVMTFDTCLWLMTNIHADIQSRSKRHRVPRPRMDHHSLSLCLSLFMSTLTGFITYYALDWS